MYHQSCNELIILVGNIGSGKSTLSKKLAKAGYIIICRDALRYMVGAGEYIFDILIEPMISLSTLDILKRAIDRSLNIVIDECNMSAQCRESYINIAKEHDEYKLRCIQLPILSKKESVARRIQASHGNTPKRTWSRVWSMFNRVHQEPTLAEGFHEIIKLRNINDLII